MAHSGPNDKSVRRSVDNSASVDDGVTTYPKTYPQQVVTLTGTVPGTFTPHGERMNRLGFDPDYATVGGILLDSTQLDAVSGWLRPEDFANPLCGEIYELVTTMRAGATPIDPVTVLGELRRGGRLRSDGYPAGELIAMIEAVPVPASTPYYARMVLEGAMFRRIERCGERIRQVGRGRRGSPDDAFDVVGRGWRDLAEIRDRWQQSAPTHVQPPADRDRQASARQHEPAAAVRAR
jgi:replicative DNA helicase